MVVLRLRRIRTLGLQKGVLAACIEALKEPLAVLGQDDTVGHLPPIGSELRSKLNKTVLLETLESRTRTKRRDADQLTELPTGN